ncbi:MULTISPECIES: ArsR/SmtB family transcription factor [Labrys]|jgi:DNA-binding transcriptional ArsR family regulator|uniref:ArsR/SmtB family transcription factor n=1 Tax=Labrys TaxID=204476 RepID=UPI00082BEE04|nr:MULTISPECIES: metalloregulator ArsR/SmtB family transcription factor [unclassified Labrys (in: a-proteobacteria)]MDZ5449717.1 metalloregulator ArsR/SmtB family transcription factor [Labrys sp. ZIDIC5]OCC04921.1 transcriptional regulator [Labrys sp. WJW]
MKQHPHPDVNDINLIGVLAALGDPVRLHIVTTLLAEGEKGSTEFDCQVANSTLSHHIKQLREAGIVSHRKEGTRCFVALRPDIDEKFPGLLQSVLKFAD